MEFMQPIVTYKSAFWIFTMVFFAIKDLFGFSLSMQSNF